MPILLNGFEKEGRIQKRWNIDYKFKKLDPVIYRKEHSNTGFDFNKEPICFIKNRIEDIKSMPGFGKDKLFREGKKYDIFRIYKNPFLYDKSNQRFEYVNEDELSLYKGKDREVLKIIDNIYQKYETKN